MDDFEFEETMKPTPEDDLISNPDQDQRKISIVHRKLLRGSQGILLLTGKIQNFKYLRYCGSKT